MSISVDQVLNKTIDCDISIDELFPKYIKTKNE